MSERRWTLAEIAHVMRGVADEYWPDVVEELNALPEPSLPPETGKRDLPIERGNGEFDEDAARIFASQLMNAHYEECFIGGARWQFEVMKK